jgi:hypothetical protein
LRTYQEAVDELRDMANHLPQALVGEPITLEYQAVAALLMIHEAITDLTAEVERIRERL